MTTPDQSPASPSPAPAGKDRIYRSPAALVGGVLLIAIIGWLGIDALVNGHGRTPWLALAGMILVLPLVIAFTLRPAVFANEDRIRVRNPFRIVTLPWGEIVSLRSSYSNEVVTKSGAKYQLWAVPVSLRARKKVARRQTRASMRGGGGRFGRTGGLGGGFGFGGAAHDIEGPAGPARAETDQIVDDLRQLLEKREHAESAQGEVSARWSYEIIAPAVAGAVLLVILLAIG